MAQAANCDIHDQNESGKKKKGETAKVRGRQKIERNSKAKRIRNENKKRVPRKENREERKRGKHT